MDWQAPKFRPENLNSNLLGTRRDTNRQQLNSCPRAYVRNPGTNIGVPTVNVAFESVTGEAQGTIGGRVWKLVTCTDEDAGPRLRPYEEIGRLGKDMT